MSITKTATLQPAKIFSFAFPVYFFIHCTVVYIYFLVFLSFFARVISISMVFLNKYLLSSPDLKVRSDCKFSLPSASHFLVN